MVLPLHYRESATTGLQVLGNTRNRKIVRSSANMSRGAVLLMIGLGLILILIGMALFKQMWARRNHGASDVTRESLGKDLSQD